jgi:tRNA-Thr(GGU) m(6)t(6)A37 methyltransferase TsaA
VGCLGKASELGIDRLAGAKARIDRPGADQLLKGPGVTGAARIAALANWHPIPRQPEPAQVIFDRKVELRADPGMVDVFKAQQEASAMGAGKVVGDQRGESMAKVEQACRAGSKAGDHGNARAEQLPWWDARVEDGKIPLPGSYWPSLGSSANAIPMDEWSMRPVGTLRSCFGGKFAVPRQPGLAAAARAELVLAPWCRSDEIVRGLEGFSHVWLIFVFHEVAAQGWNPTVRPPRLGGNQRVGVFASRSPFRPNPLGLSVVQLDGIRHDPEHGPVLLLSGIDLVDATPVLDVKPYLAYADAHPDARAGFAAAPPVRLKVSVAAAAAADFDALDPRDQATLRDVLSLDPRPAAHAESERIYGAQLCGRNVRFRITAGTCEIVAIGGFDVENPPGSRYGGIAI